MNSDKENDQEEEQEQQNEQEEEEQKEEGEEQTEKEPNQEADDAKESPEKNHKESPRKPQVGAPLAAVATKESFDEDVDFELAVKEPEVSDPKVAEEIEFMKTAEPTTRLELALTAALKRKDAHFERITQEIHKLRAFISKRKQTYKRKRKDEGAPTRALSAYNIFVQDRFAKLAKENEEALKSADSDAQLKRVPPANLVASTGNMWKDLPMEQKAKYSERYVTCCFV
jgi:hypothetical protein